MSPAIKATIATLIICGISILLGLAVYFVDEFYLLVGAMLIGPIFFIWTSFYMMFSEK